MNQVKLHQWKQFCQVMALGWVDDYDIVQVNMVDGDDCIRTYHDNAPQPVARMVVHDANTDTESVECERTFWIADNLLALCSDIVILTDEDWAEWDAMRPEDDDEQWLRDRGVL